MSIEECNLAGYALHAKNMSKRVRDRNDHPELSAIDRFVERAIRQKAEDVRDRRIRILDIGCGTGERMKMVLERAGVALERLEIVGIDRCLPLLEECEGKALDGKRIFAQLIECDAKDIELDLKFDIILALFSVLNNVGDLEALKVWKGFLADDGLLIFDALHPATQNHFFIDDQDLKERFGDDCLYYRRGDGSFGAAKVWGSNDIIEMVVEAGLKIVGVVDVLNYKTGKRKGSHARPYIRIPDGWTPGPGHEKAWPNSILFICSASIDAATHTSIP